MGDILGNPRLHSVGLAHGTFRAKNTDKGRGGQKHWHHEVFWKKKKKKPTPLFEKRKLLPFKCPEIEYIYLTVSTALYILKLIIDRKTVMTHKH